MANVLKIDRPKVPATKVTVELTEGECDMLIAVLSSIGGSPVESPRKYAQRLLYALNDSLGYGYEGTDAYPLMRGSIQFSPYGYKGSSVRFE